MNENTLPPALPLQENEIILYQPDSTTSLDVRVAEETVWLTQAQIVELFASGKSNVSEHLKIFLNPKN